MLITAIQAIIIIIISKSVQTLYQSLVEDVDPPPLKCFYIPTIKAYSLKKICSHYTSLFFNFSHVGNNRVPTAKELLFSRTFPGQNIQVFV